MNFEQAGQQYSQLAAQYHAGQLAYEQFCQAVDELRVQDNRGTWWQLSYDGKWLWWNGTAWAAADCYQSGSQNQLSTADLRRAANYANAAYGTAQAIASGNAAGALGRAATMLRPLSGKSQKWWSVLSIFGGGLGGALWYWYSTLDNRPDPITSLIMLLVPVLLIILRRPVDSLLRPLIPIRQRLPRLLIVGIGIAAPYLVATFLYDNMRLSNYPYIRWTVFLGPLLSYIIIRSPNVTGSSYNGNNQGYPNYSGRR